MPEKHLTRQATEVIKREKKNSSAPVINAPIMLVAAKVIPKRMIDVRIVPSIPAIIRPMGVLRQRQIFLQANRLVVKSRTAR